MASLVPHKFETIWPVIVVELSPYKLLVPPHLQSCRMKKTLYKCRYYGLFIPISYQCEVGLRNNK